MIWNWIKVPKSIALATFLLPWMTVSCQSQQLAKATGFGLATGNIETMGRASGESGHFNFLLILAIVSIVVGLFLAFKRDRTAAKLSLASSSVALVLVWLGTFRYSQAALMDAAAKRNPDGGPDASAMMAMIRIDWHIGYYLTITALIAAIAMAWVVMSGREDVVTEKIGKLADDAQASVASASSRLAAATAMKACPKCGRSLNAGTKFCPDDGTAIDAEAS